MENILLVDDKQEILTLFSAILTDANFATAKAHSGAEALAALDKLIPDLIILDVAMPGMNGIELCRAIRSLPHTSQTPILMLSALGDMRTVMSSLDGGATDYLTKPIRGPELVRKVHELIMVHKVHDPSNEQSDGHAGKNTHD